MNRSAFLERILDAREPVDVVVVGGGATGAGIALDAAVRGLSTVLIERGDFGCGTSSRSSKLIHGGIRYLAMGQVSLVREALRERALLLNNASAVVTPLPFLVPATGRFELLKFATGLKVYDWLGGSKGVGASASLDNATVQKLAPGLRDNGVFGAVRYFDAGFDDARLLVAVLKRAAEHGALTINYAEVEALLHDAGGRVRGVAIADQIEGEKLELEARCVINATGPHSDELRKMDGGDGPGAVAPSQGAHIVVDGRFLGGDHAVVLPETPDGRIMFAIPWSGKLLLGTTDTALGSTPREPVPLPEEIAQILDVAASFLDPAPTANDILSAFAGVRPLAAVPAGGTTAKISREHAIDVSASGLISISGGKWTTYRHMAEACVELAVRHHGLTAADKSTRSVKIACASSARAFALDEIEQQSFDAMMAERPEYAEPVHQDLPYLAGHYAWAARHEMAQNVDDALAFRTRAAFIDARAAREAAPHVARIMAAELNRSEDWTAQQIDRANSTLARYRGTPDA